MQLVHGAAVGARANPLPRKVALGHDVVVDVVCPEAGDDFTHFFRLLPEREHGQKQEEMQRDSKIASFQP